MGENADDIVAVCFAHVGEDLIGICDTGGRLSVRQEKDNWRELESRLNRLAVSKGQQKSVVDVSRRTNFHFFHKLFGSIYGALRYWISKNVVEFSERV